MKIQDLDVAVIGGGIGGLCLAHGLKKAGVPVRVYERDESGTARTQGFRIHIDPDGSRALHQCLPAQLWDVFTATGGLFSQGFSMLTDQLEELLHRAGDDAPPDPIAQHRSISRVTLRALLLAGLEAEVEFGKRFAHFEELPAGRRRAWFDDGTFADANVLVGADGVNSPVRRQYLPQAEPAQTGVVTIAGRLPLTAGILALVPKQLLDGPALVVPPGQSSLFMGLWKRSRESAEVLRRLGGDPSVADEDDHLVFGLAVRADRFGILGDPRSIPGTQLMQIVRRAMKGWHPDLRKLSEMIDEDALVANPLRSSRRISAWQSTPVTLLGDAIHSMTPFQGIGANIALKDAALLCSQLIQAQRGEKELLTAIAEYENSMRTYAFKAVDASLRSMEFAILRKQAPVFQIAKTAMRLVNQVAKLNRLRMAA